MTDGLKDAHRAAIIATIATNERVERAVLFGSRATGTNTMSSDVDIVLFGDRLTLTDQAQLAAALDEIPMAQSVDLLLYGSIRSAKLREQIRTRGVEWHARPGPRETAVGAERREIESEAATLVESDKRSEPMRWGTSRWGEIVTLEYGRALRDYETAQGAFRVYGTNGPIGWHDEPLFEGPTVVVGRKGAYRGIHYSPVPCFVIDTAFYVKPRIDIDLRWAYYTLLTTDINGMDSGSAIPSTSRSDFYGLPVSVPPRSEQSAIAHVLGTLDDKIELNRRTNATLEEMARALFRSWFVDFDPVRAKMEGRDTGLPKDIADLFPNRLVDSELGNIPDGWIVRKLGDLCHKPQYGYTASARSEPIGPRFLRITDINKDSWVSWSRVPYCEATDDERTRYSLTKGDVLIARMADPGHGVMIEEDVEAVFASYLIRFRPAEDRNARLLQYWLKSDAYWELVRGQAAGTTRVSLNAKVLSLFPLVVPPADVASAFTVVVGGLRRRLVQSAREMQVLSDLRDTLLPKLVSGELRVTGLEPASVRDDRPTSVGAHGA